MHSSTTRIPRTCKTAITSSALLFLLFLCNCPKIINYGRGSTVPNQPAGVFWAVVSSLLILFQAVILFCECCRLCLCYE